MRIRNNLKGMKSSLNMYERATFMYLGVGSLATKLNSFNEKLVDWLLWYNTERPHQLLGMLSPLYLLLMVYQISSAISGGRVQLTALLFSCFFGFVLVVAL